MVTIWWRRDLEDAARDAVENTASCSSRFQPTIELTLNTARMVTSVRKQATSSAVAYRFQLLNPYPGKTVPENCQMLCAKDNRTESGK